MTDRDHPTTCPHLRSSGPPDRATHWCALAASDDRLREAARLALEAIEERYIGALRDQAIDALREALGDRECD